MIEGLLVIPAQAGIQFSMHLVPACARTTVSSFLPLA
jgi:hypothetical protein